jgi:hypothetical protein
MGPWVGEIEKKIGDLMGAKYAIGVRLCGHRSQELQYRSRRARGCR